MNYRIEHKTRYTYDEPVGGCHNEARLTPREFPGQQCTDNRLDIAPVPDDIMKRIDFFGNIATYFAIQQRHEALTITSTSNVRITVNQAQRDLAGDVPWEDLPMMWEKEKRSEMRLARQFALDSPFVAGSRAMADYAALSFTPRRPLLDAVQDLMRRIHTDFEYNPDVTTIATPLTTVLEHRRGVCQDFAHLAIGCVRSLGLAARYVSGYIETIPSDEKQALVGADASHAWFSVYSPVSGWVDFDPTNNQLPAGQHITLAWGRDYSDVTPVKGVIYSSGSHRLTVAVKVERMGAD